MNSKRENFAKYFFAFSAVLSIVFVILIFAFLIKTGVSGISKIGFLDFIGANRWKPTADAYGIFSMIVTTFYITFLALIIATPIGLLSSIYLAFYAKKQYYGLLKQGINLLASIPSVVYGFFGVMVIVPFIRDTFRVSGSSILAGGIVLGIMILPTIITLSETSLRGVDKSYYEGALGLGTTKERTIFTVVVPAAKSGIITSIILAMGRAIGETMAVIMVTGNQARIPSSLLEGARTLTSNIVLEMGYATGLHREALVATALVLLVITFLVNIVLNYFTRKV